MTFAFKQVYSTSIPVADAVPPHTSYYHSRGGSIVEKSRWRQGGGERAGRYNGSPRSTGRLFHHRMPIVSWSFL